MINLRYCLYGASEHGEKDPPSEVIEKLGIKYERWEGHPICEQIWLYGCTNVPSELPPYITVKG